MKIFYVLCSVLFFFSCASVPKEENVPKSMEVIDLVQKAQEAFEVSNYRGAKKWYEIVLNRFGDDISVRVEAEYEIAHILTKQKKWKDAYIHLKKLIARYEESGGMRLPQEFYKLATMDYEKVIKKLSPIFLQSFEKKTKNEKEDSESDTFVNDNVSFKDIGDNTDAILIEDLDKNIE